MDETEQSLKCGGALAGRSRSTKNRREKDQAHFHAKLSRLVKQADLHGFFACSTMESDEEEIGYNTSTLDGCPTCVAANIAGALVVTFSTRFLRMLLPNIEAAVKAKEEAEALGAGKKEAHA